MVSMRDDRIRLRDPRYTGVNRCLPCTSVNLIIAGGLAAVVATASVPWAIGVLAVSTGVIAVRGYLVPGTPTLTKRYLPDRVLAWFDKLPEQTGVGDSESTAPVDVGDLLVDADVLREDAALDDYVLDRRFETVWTARARELADINHDETVLADFLDVATEAVRLTDRGSAYVASIDGEWAGQWESRAAFVADLAAADVLDDRVHDWDTLSTANRSEVMAGLRLFLEQCPRCEGLVTLGTTVVESCCREYDVLAATCVDCDTRLFEADVDPAALERLAGSE